MSNPEIVEEIVNEGPLAALLNIVNSNDNLIKLDLPELPTGSTSIFRPLFPQQDRGTCKKRSIQEFLEDYNTTVVPTNNSDNDDNDSGDYEENQLPQETHEALYGLGFPVDKLYRKVLKLHQVSHT
jgi:hypothetical protein